MVKLSGKMTPRKIALGRGSVDVYFHKQYGWLARQWPKPHNPTMSTAWRRSADGFSDTIATIKRFLPEVRAAYKAAVTGPGRSWYDLAKSYALRAPPGQVRIEAPGNITFAVTGPDSLRITVRKDTHQKPAGLYYPAGVYPWTTQGPIELLQTTFCAGAASTCPPDPVPPPDPLPPIIIPDPIIDPWPLCAQVTWLVTGVNLAAPLHWMYATMPTPREFRPMLPPMTWLPGMTQIGPDLPPPLPCLPLCGWGGPGYYCIRETHSTDDTCTEKRLWQIAIRYYSDYGNFHVYPKCTCVLLSGRWSFDWPIHGPYATFLECAAVCPAWQ